MRLTPSTATSYTAHRPSCSSRRYSMATSPLPAAIRDCTWAYEPLMVSPLERDGGETVVSEGVQVGPLEEIGEEHHEVPLLFGGGIRPALPKQATGHLVEVEQLHRGLANLRPPLSAFRRVGGL